MTKEILFSVTAKDCEWSYTRGTGKGGQKRNVTDSAVHCMHRPSGAHGYSENSRSQHENKIKAFGKMYASKEFQKWFRMEINRRNGTLLKIDDKVNREMDNIRVEIIEDDKWIKVDKHKELIDD